MSDAATLPAAEAAAPRDRRWLRWPLLIAAFIALVWLGGVAITLLIAHTRLQQRLTHRLETVFGRHVEVHSYDFSLWSGPTLTAESVTFAEDPRFGHEYFLRADSVRVRLHWQSLFRGRMDLGTVTLDRPSLNLVRNANGDWNLGEWLPRITNGATNASSASGSSTASAPPYVRFDRIRFDDGRINFKRADEKIPFAFVGVAGSVEPDSPGRWRIDLEAVPTRAAVQLQQPGLIHVAAQVGGTSSRFRPANVALSWSEGSVSDLLRLTRGNDFGVRGDFSVAINAHTDTDDWLLETRTHFRSLHRWDLTLRPDNPDFNVLAKFTVHPQGTGFDIDHATIEAPHSSAEAAAHISWNGASNPVAAFSAPALAGLVTQPTEVRITNSQIDLADVLAWIRAFHSDVAPDAALTGYAAATATFAANPPRLASAYIRTTGIALTSSTLPEPARLTAVTLHYDKDSVSLDPATLTFGDLGSTLHLDSSRSSARDAATFHVAGSVTQLRDLVATAAALGWPISRGWAVTGPARFDLRWPANGATPWKSPVEGTMDWGDLNAATIATDRVADGTDATPSRDATLLAPFLNQPVRGIRAHVELRQGTRRVTLASADAFDARWTGTIERRESAAEGWQFALSADKLSTSAVDRWLNPRWRQSFLDRVFGRASTVAATPEALHATGRLTIDQLTVAPLVARHVQGDFSLNGRLIEFKDASAQIASGNVTGTVRAALAAVPEYHVKLNFAGVDLSDLTAAVPSLAGQFDGSASGEITLASHGGTRSDLVAALACDGTAHVSNAQLKQINLDATLRQGEFRTGAETFRDVNADFSCLDGSIDFRRLIFAAPTGRLDATGSVDFSRGLDLTFVNAATPTAASYQLTGTLASPSLAKAPKP